MSVSPELWQAVMERDGMCLLAKLEWPGHQCRTRFGRNHAPDDIRFLTLEHVKSELRMGVRAEDDMGHCVALCGMANDMVPTKVQRAAFRVYLAGVAA